MVTHFSVLAWRIPWTEELGRLQSMGSKRVGLSDFYSLTCMENYASSFFFFSKSKVATNLDWGWDLKRRKYHRNAQLSAVVLHWPKNSVGFFIRSYGKLEQIFWPIQYIFFTSS